MTANKKRQTIAIDIDDVLANNAKKFIEFSNNYWNTSLTINDYDEDFSKLWQVDNIEVERRVNEYFRTGIISNYDHDSEANIVLNELKNHFNLILVTSRKSILIDDTKAWINRYYPGIFDDKNIHFAGIWDVALNENSVKLTKGDLIKQLGADYLIDDQIKHCLSAAEFGIETVLFGNYSWNRLDILPQNVQRADNWLDIMEYFNERI